MISFGASFGFAVMGRISLLIGRFVDLISYSKAEYHHATIWILIMMFAILLYSAITEKKIKILQEADYIYVEELKKHNLYNKIWQAYAALLPVKTVGVMGDNRTYEYICLLRAITSEDGMTADFFNFNKKFMQIVSNKIINNIRGINRVVYDVTSKPPSTIELE